MVEQSLKEITMEIFGKEDNTKKVTEFEYIQNDDFDYRIYYFNNSKDVPSLSFMVLEGCFSEITDQDIITLMMNGWCAFDGFRHVWVNEGYFHYASPDEMIAIWTDLKKLALKCGVKEEEL